MEITEVVLPRLGGPEVLRVQRRTLGPPEAGQATVRVEATGVSFAEQGMLRGAYPGQPKLPFVPGYDLVGIVVVVGDGVEHVRVGQRVAALTKTGGWADHASLRAADLVAVPDGVDATAAETVVVNGLTAWKMLHRLAKVRPGQTVVVLGANGGVGSTLVQLARDHGVRVIGTASARHDEAVRGLGAEFVDRRDPDLPARVRELAPDGVDAVFDHIGGPGLDDSWRMLRSGGTLVSYGSASTRDDGGSAWMPLLKMIPKVTAWNLLPNSRHAYFFNLWGGKLLTPAKFHAELRTDLAAVLDLLAAGRIRAHIAGVLPLAQVADAMRLAESGTTSGKVVLVPGPSPMPDGSTPTRQERRP